MVSLLIVLLLIPVLLAAWAGYVLVIKGYDEPLKVMLSLCGGAAALSLFIAFGPGQFSANQINAFIWGIGITTITLGLGIGSGIGFMHRKNRRETH